MGSLNSCQLLGLALTDPITRILPEGETVILQMRLKRRFFSKNLQERVESVVDWDLEIRGKASEFTKTHIRKGNLILVEGSTDEDQIACDHCGQKRKKITVRVISHMPKGKLDEPQSHD